MWLMGHWIMLSKEILYGVGFAIFLGIIIFAVIKMKGRKKTALPPKKVIFKGVKLDQAEQELPIVDLPWDKKGRKRGQSKEDLEEEEDSEEGDEDDGYTVVEKTLQSGKPQLMKPPSPPQKKNVEKISVAQKKKNPEEDKVDFFTSNKSAL